MTQSSTQAPIRTGLIGLGAAGRMMHVPLIDATEGIELAAVCTSRPDLAEQIAPTARHHATPAALMADREIDLVVIATPNDSHAELARAAILGGKHVLVEKPFCLDRAEAAALLRLADEHDRVVCVFQNRRFDSDFLTVRHAIADGHCGQVRSFESRMERFKPIIAPGWSAPVEPGAGGWYDFGAHLVDQAVELFGRPLHVTARFASLRDETAADDWGQAILGYARHEVVLHYSLTARGASPSFVVHGSQASLFKHGDDPQGMQMMQGLAPGAPGWGVDSDPLLRIALGAEAEAIPALPGDYGRFYGAVAAAIRGDGVNPTPPGQILDVLAVLEAGVRSAKEGIAILLPLTTEPPT
ncbi:Gfo/Idh/MocA family oxidoreductase [Novosphingobium resinovorum]|uniref:Gfo/Idh/MocA family oxidoreductase n=1 Tax=Novosphingobium resinovorum TaxID=158500 RepID=UPI002ED6231E|nr:Gfo/Idh/MocA family oxidoreductase [Novosphingobium resinovorum]